MSREGFQKLLRRNAPLDIAVGEEVEWFGDTMQTILGTVGFSTNSGWSIAILKFDEAGGFRICERQGNFVTRHAARFALLRQMTTGERVEAERIAA